MTPREFRISETREWLERAQADRAACGALIDVGLPSEALFHTQQCAEKALKAFLVWHQTPFDKTHDLDRLKNLCVPLTAGSPIQLDGIGDLTQYAWRFRYPGAPYTPERKEAAGALRRASALLDDITAQLNTEFNRA